jgi:hypothetical protein
MARSIYSVFDNIFEKQYRSTITGDIVEYIHNRRGEDLDVVVQQYMHEGFSKSNTTRFVNQIQTAIRTLITEENTEGLLTRSKQEIVKVAEDRNIPLRSYDKLVDLKSESDWFSRSALKLDGLDEPDQIKQSLRWVNCLTEFYSGEALFKEKTKSIAITFDKLKLPQDEEDSIYQLWRQGYLQCDLDR